VLLALTGRMLGFALSPDGAAIYAGSVEDGLYAGARGDTALAPRSAIHVQCLAARDAELWACADDQVSGFVAGMSTDQGATFVPRLHLGSASAPIACAPGGATACGADANASQCTGAPFAQLCESVGCADAGSPGTRSPPPSSSCRCESAGRRGPWATAAAFVLLVAGGALGRRATRMNRRGRT
jgi:hypothetical protein